MNNTTESHPEFEICLRTGSNKFRLTRIVGYSTLALVTYFGNTLILVSLWKFAEQFKGTLYILLGNLAVADLLLAIGLTVQIIGFILTPLEGNLYFCAVIACIQGVSLTTSGILLMLISLDRLCAIMFPVKHLVHSTKIRRRRIKLVLVWVLSLTVICIPVIIKSSLSPDNGTCKSCDMIAWEISLAASVFVPMQIIINIGLCLIVIWRLKTNTKSKQKYKSSMVKCGILIKVYVVFAICWSPHVVTTILMETTDENQKFMAARVYTIVPVLMNSAMNWIIYGLANTKLRDAFKNVLLCRNKRHIRVSNYFQSKASDNTEGKTKSVEDDDCETKF